MIEIIHKDAKTQARCGKIETQKGIIETPAFVLKTHNLKIGHLETKEIIQTKSQILKTDAFEIWEILSDEGINFSTGIHDILKWQKSIITDSGSLKILKLKQNDSKNNEIEILNSGINFLNSKKGIEGYFDAETSLKIQEELNSDIITAFDLPIECQKNLDIVLAQTEKSHIWQTRFLEAKSSNQLILGVIGGGIFDDLIKLSANFLTKFNLNGIVFGNCLGKINFQDILKIIKVSSSIIPETQIRYVKNIKTIKEIFEAVELGIDLFDSPLPYQSLKNNIALTNSDGQINLNNPIYANDESLLDEFCQCPLCEEGEIKKNIYWNLKLKNKKSQKDILIHNIYFINNLMENIREAIKKNKLEELKKHYYL